MRDAFCREASEGRRGGSAFSAVNYPQRLRRQSRDTAEHRLVLWGGSKNNEIMKYTYT